jgi:hypothetical protein
VPQFPSRLRPIVAHISDLVQIVSAFEIICFFLVYPTLHASQHGLGIDIFVFIVAPIPRHGVG